MKIIKEGKSGKIRLYIFECDECGCVFECPADECKSEFSGLEYYFKHRCPMCGVEVQSNEE